MSGKTPVSWIGIAPLLCLVLFVGLAPFGSALYNSFFHDTYGERSFAGLSHYRRFFTSEEFGYSFRITLLWSLLNTALSLLGGFWFALFLSRRRRISGLFYLILLIPWGIPVYIAVPLWRVLLHGSGGRSLLTALFGVRLNLLLDPAAGFFSALTVSVWMLLPLTAFVLAGAMQKIPRAATEAARLEGASEVQVATALVLPQVRGSILVMTVLNFLKSFKEFSVVFLMTAGGPPLLSGMTSRTVVGATQTVEITLYELFQTTEDFGVPAAFAVVTAALVLLIMVYWYFARNRARRRDHWSGSADRDRRAGAVEDSRLLFFTALMQPLFGGLTGLPWAAGYLVSIKWRGAFRWIVAAQCAVMIVRLGFQGYPAGIDPGLAAAGLAWMLLRSRRGQTSPPGRLLGTAWRFGSAAAAVLTAAASCLILYLVFWLSASRIGSAFVDSPLPRFFSLESYRRIVMEEGILRYFGNSLILAAAAALLLPILTFPAAAVLARRGGRLSLAVIAAVQIIAVSGGMHSLIPLYAIFRGLGLIDSIVPLVILYTAHAVPFSLFTITAYLKKLPPSLWENARLAGMSRTAYLLRILAPLSLPVVVTSVMVAFTGAWNGFLAPLLFLNDDAKYTVSVKLYSLIGTIAGGSPRWNLFAAASVLNLLLLSLVFLRFRRPLQRSFLAYHED